MGKKGSSEDEPSMRKRGRPAGKNRVPLTLEERRARNTQYERERRNEKSRAMTELAEAAGCEPTISAPDLLATVISQIQNAAKRKSSEDIENLRQINDNLMSQITKLEKELKMHCPEFESNSTDEEDLNIESSSKQKPAKSLSSSSSDTRLRNRKTNGKRKRKTRCEESDTQDSVDRSTESDDEMYEPKRLKSQLKTQNEILSRRQTRNCSTSQSSYETHSSQSDHMKHEVHTMYQTEFDRQSDSTHHTSQIEQSSESSIAMAPRLNDSNRPAELELPSGYDHCRSWTTDYIINQPRPEYSPELDYSSMPTVQEALNANEIPNDLGSISIENFNFLEDGDVNFISDQCEWLDSLILNSSVLDNGGNNLVYS